MGDLGNVLLALVAIAAPLLLAGWLLGRKPRPRRSWRAPRDSVPGRDNMAP